MWSTRNETSNQCDETSEVKSNVDPEEKNEEVPKLVRCRLTRRRSTKRTPCSIACVAAASRGPPLEGDTARTGASLVQERSHTSIQTRTSPITKSSTSPMTLSPQQQRQ